MRHVNIKDSFKQREEVFIVPLLYGLLSAIGMISLGEAVIISTIVLGVLLIIDLLWGFIREMKKFITAILDDHWNYISKCPCREWKKKD